MLDFRYVVLFDASCTSCSRIAEEIRIASDDRISVQSIRGPWAMQNVSADQLSRVKGPGLVRLSPSGDAEVTDGFKMLIALARLLGPRRGLKVYSIARRELGAEPISHVLSRRSLLGGIGAGAATAVALGASSALAAGGHGSDAGKGFVLGDAVLLSGVAAEAAKARMRELAPCDLLSSHLKTAVPKGAVEEEVYETPVLLNESTGSTRAGTIVMYSVSIKSGAKFGRMVALSTTRGSAPPTVICDAVLGDYLPAGRGFHAVGYRVENGVVVPSGNSIRDDKNIDSASREVRLDGRVLTVSKEAPAVLSDASSAQAAALPLTRCEICVRVQNILQGSGCSVLGAFVIAAVCGPGALACAVIAGAVMAAACTGFIDFSSPGWCRQRGYC